MTDNQQLRELFTLPPIQSSANTALAAPEMPPQQTVTGDREVDAVLWLQQVVKTGNQALIDKALEAAKRITTPMKELGKRYADHIVRTTGNTLGAAFASFGFGDLEGQGKRAVERAALRHEALSRFGTVDALFANTPAEAACIEALRRCKRGKHYGYDDAAAMARFSKRPALVPATMPPHMIRTADCRPDLARSGARPGRAPHKTAKDKGARRKSEARRKAEALFKKGGDDVV